MTQLSRYDVGRHRIRADVEQAMGIKRGTNENIQALRGFAVALVVLFHLDAPGFAFGYIGVDIFFLLSGYLMPSIIGKYDAWTYIKARIRRLYPALAVMVAACGILAYLLMMPGEYKTFAESSLSALAFLSEFYFQQKTGYFDQDATLQPLLHTWSLGNEFLGYLILFAFLLALPRRHLVPAATALCIAALMYTVVRLETSGIGYLDPLPRLFLFFAGYVAAAIQVATKFGNRSKIFIATLGISGICILYGGPINQKLWPNYGIVLLPFAVVPLLSLGELSGKTRALYWAPVKLGDWSYSIYIWHWPLIVFEKVYLRNDHIGTMEGAGLLLVSVLAGALSFRLLEKGKVLAICATVVALLGAAVALSTSGAEFRVPKHLRDYSSIYKMIGNDENAVRQSSQGLDYLKVKDGVAGPGVLIVGDSHSKHVIPFIAAGFGGSVYRLPALPAPATLQWGAIVRLAKELRVDRIILAYRYSDKDIVEVAKLIETAAASDLPVLYLRDIPSFDGDPVACLFANESSLKFRSCGFDIRAGLPAKKVKNANDPVWAHIQSVVPPTNMLDTHRRLCTPSLCLTSIDGEFIYRDNNHFNEMMSASTNAKIYDMLFNQD